jgi:hypothetical protein
MIFAGSGHGYVTAMTDSQGPRRPLGWRDPYGLVMRRLVYLSTACVIGSAVVIAATVGTGWSWWLLVWGVALGALAIAFNELLVRVVVRVVRPSETDLERMRSRRHEQRLVVFPASLGMGCAIGLIAASLQNAWPDVLIAVVVVVVSEVALPLAMLPWLSRRAAVIRARSAEATDNAN